ncbi:MAG: MOSC domain-containing protein [Ilumatobacteraceae bacterium]
MPSTTTVPTCSDCGFDAARWSDDDVERTLFHAEGLLEYTLAAAPDDVRQQYLPRAASHQTDALADVHDVMHDLAAAARSRAAVEPFEPMVGTIESLQAATGVPKGPVPDAVVDGGGIVGDVQTNRRNHGRPWQALCLYSADVIDALRSEGHPITPGGAGENLTIRGLDWSRMRGGLTIDIGDVRAFTSSPAAPCHKIGDNFIDREWNRIGHEGRPGWSRWYASVLSGGTIRPGDLVRVTA